MRLRVRGPQGVVTITIEDTASWQDLLHQIREKTGVQGEFDLKYGYPPNPLDTKSTEGATRLFELPIDLNGEQIIVMPRETPAAITKPMSSSNSTAPVAKPASQQEASAPRANQAGESSNQPLGLTRKPRGDIESDPPEIPVPLLEGLMVLRVMPDDNSCMFRALSSAVLGLALDGMTELRSVVAQTIQANQDFYTAGLLEKEPSAYCRWIQREDSWGGGIELSILSQHFNIEICSINVQDLRIDRFNEGQPTRCILVYSGIHYDVCAVSPFSGADPEFDRKVFDVLRTDGEEIDGGALTAASELCRALQSRHYFTDTHGFTVKCNTCGQAGTGEQWAVQHAQSTGHSDFGEG